MFLKKMKQKFPLIGIGLLLLSLFLLQMFAVSEWKLDSKLTDYFLSDTSKGAQRADLDFLETNLNNAPWQTPILLTLRVKPNLTLEKRQAVSRAFQKWAESQPEIQKVRNGPSELLSSQTPLFSYRYLYEDLHADQLTERIAQLWKAWQLGFVPDKQLALADPTQTWYRYLSRLHPTSALPSQAGIWSTKTRLLFFLELAPTVADAQRDRFLQEFDHRLNAFLSHQEVEMPAQWSSPAKIASYARSQVETNVQRLIWLTGLGVTLFLFWVFRRIDQLLWILLPVFTGLWGGALITQLGFGSLNVLTLAFGSLLIGVAVDFPIHVLAGNRVEKRQAKKNWTLVGMGGITTLTGLTSIGFLPIEGFRQLAVFCVSGLSLALLVTFLMSVWLSNQITEDKRSASASPIPLQQIWLHHAWSRPSLLTIWVVILFGVLWMHPPVWEDDLASISPVPKALLQESKALQSQFKQPQTTQMLIVTSNDMEALLRQEERIFQQLNALKASNKIGGYLGLANLLPSQSLQRLRQSNLPSQSSLKEAVVQAKTELPMRLFTPFIQNVEKARDSKVLNWERWRQLVPDELRTLAEHLIKTPSDVHDPKAGWVGYIWLYGHVDSKALQTFADNDINITYFDQRTLVAEIVGQVSVSFLTILPWSLLIMTLLLGWFIGKGAFSVMLVVSLAATLTLMTLALFTPLSIFHGVAVILVMAMGVDYALFVRASRFQKDPVGKKLSVLVAMITTLIAFGLLFSSGISILVTLGSTVFLGVLYSYWVAQVVYSSRNIGKSTENKGN